MDERPRNLHPDLPEEVKRELDDMHVEHGRMPTAAELRDAGYPNPFDESTPSMEIPEDVEERTAFGNSDPSELIPTAEARLAHLRMVVRGTLKAMAAEEWDAALNYL